jgi:hypothetical protein
MPDFVFQGASPGMYPMLRDSFGILVGTVEPGDLARFDAAPDADWQPYEDAPTSPGWEPHTDSTGAPGWRLSEAGEQAADETPDAPSTSDQDPGGETTPDDDTAPSGQEEG